MFEKTKLLSLLGSFWTGLFEGRQLAADLVMARCRRHEQSESDYAFLRDACSIATLRLVRPVKWYRLRLFLSQRNKTTSTQTKYGEGSAYGNDSGVAYGQFGVRRTPAWSVPPQLVSAKTAQNRINAASVVWTQDQGFEIAEGSIRFDTDPFDNPDFATVPVVANDTVTDSYVDVWLGGCGFDEDTLQRQYGYTLGGRWPSTGNSKRTVAAIYDSLNHGTTRKSTEELVAAYLDTPVAYGSETVQEIVAEQDRQWIVTDRSSYRCGSKAVPAVAVGQTVVAGQQLTRAVEWHEQVLPADLPALVASPLFTGLDDSLVFLQKDLPTTVTYDATGRAVLRFDVRGFSGTVDRFWQEVHSRGIDQGRTLANTLDVRPNPVGEPLAASLPTTVNPAKFLWENYYRHNTTILRVRPAQFGAGAMDTLSLSWLLRKVTPPNSVVFVVVELTAGTLDASLMAQDGVVGIRIGSLADTGSFGTDTNIPYYDTTECET